MYQYNGNNGHLLHQSLTPQNNMSNISNFVPPVASISDASLFHLKHKQSKQQMQARPQVQTQSQRPLQQQQ